MPPKRLIKKDESVRCVLRFLLIKRFDKLLTSEKNNGIINHSKVCTERMTKL